jgi:hypothetical protein
MIAQHPMSRVGAQLRHFIGRSQAMALGNCLCGEEGDYFETMLTDLAQRVATMPKTYEQDGKGDEAVVYLHYFRGGMDWFITERDSEIEQHQAFGLSDIGYGGDLGYVSIEELIANGVELDLYWTPKTLAQVKASRN